MEIIYNGIVLEPWKPDYATRLAEIANNKKIGENLRDGLPFPYRVEDAIKWMNSIFPENDPPRFFAIISSGLVVGSIGMLTKDNIYRKNIEMGYFLDEKFWNKGIMTRAIRAVSAYAFENFEINRIYAEVYADNTGSRKALEKSGFSCEAVLKQSIIKNGIIKDICIYSLLRSDMPSTDIIVKL